jgi:hypothetical protein
LKVAPGLDSEAALELAVVTLGEVCRDADPETRVKASVALLQAVREEREWRRKGALTATLLPLLETLGANLSGQLEEGSPYGPVLELAPVEQGNLLLALTKATER